MNNNKNRRKYLINLSSGLQDVDGLSNSKYYSKLSKEYIDGEIELDNFVKLIDEYYENLKQYNENENEADKVSLRINILLKDNSFNFSYKYLSYIHEYLFKGILPFAGQYRKNNISKKEWVLDNDSVVYGDAMLIEKTLKYDFDQEKQFKYTSDMNVNINNIAKFISNIWQTHPFNEGNTRTIAVFLLKYLRYLGFKNISNTFKDNSWYFRNALVRANYSNIVKGINEDISFLIKFLRNLILDEHNVLSNKQLNIYCYETIFKKLNSRQQQIIKLINNQPNITSKDLAKLLDVSLITIKRDFSYLKLLKLIKRIDGKKYGKWDIKK